jgi:DNA-binding NtrC family response regulator
VFPVVIPPLRERTDDIPLLSEHFINKYCAELKTPLKKISKEASEMLVSYPWKGNVRELENCIERAIILCDGDTIFPEHMALNQRLSLEYSLKSLPAEGPLEYTAKEATRMAETQRIVRALKETRGNKSRASELLQVSYKTLLTKIKEYGIES